MAPMKASNTNIIYRKFGDRSKNLFTEKQRVQALAAERRGLDYDHEDSMYVCRRCEHAYNSIEEYTQEHVCIDSTPTLGDFINKATNRVHIPIPDLSDMILPETTLPAKVEKKDSSRAEVITPSKPTAKVWIRKAEITRKSVKTPVTEMFWEPTDKATNTEVVAKPTFAEVVKSAKEVKVAVQADAPQQAVVLDPKPVCDPFAQLTEDLAKKFAKRKNMFITVNKYGTAHYTKRKPLVKKEWVAKPVATEWGPENIITHCGERIQTQQSEQETVISETLGVIRALSKRAKRIKTIKPIKLSEDKFDMLIAQLSSIMRKRKMQFEIIGANKQIVHGDFRSSEFGTMLKVRTIHETGRKTKVDLRASREQKAFLSKMIPARSKNYKIKVNELSYGTSGFVLRPGEISGRIGRCDPNMFIVRGMHDDVLVSSTSKLTYSLIQRTRYYSSVPEEFWRGFTKCFAANTPTDITHTCTSDFKVEDCGDVAAMLTQTIFQFGKITCEKCAIEYKNLTQDEVGLRVMRELPDTIKSLQQSHPQFVHVISFLEMYARVISLNRGNMANFKQIEKIIGERTDAPFSCVNKINKILIKGNQMTTSELDEASDQLLEVAQYLKNRTENIKQGSLTSFRNKISGKAQLNPSLMCDNQLNKNGGFEWGQRSYHAKRFFDNYFEEIDPTGGYSKYRVRKNPNGTRLLAIGNLLVSTNFDTHRKSLEGIPISKQPLAQHCISRTNGNFVYPCCCVTDESGNAILSDLKPPTKHHLIIGNTGDPKFVDLPKSSEGKMYVTKEGYCYINIFLAMLVDVSEEQAKDFTKMARDIAITQLGQWPTLMDVATACNILATFHPDTRKSELPRFLVDHESKIMHVVDSYGSMSTGYHTLKANTVAQLLSFARDSLESEMKHYRVGGLRKLKPMKPLSSHDLASMGVQPGTPRHSTPRYISLLIKAIYRPSLMKAILIEEPHLLLYSMLSPGVLLALFNSGSLERTMHEFLQTNHSLSAVAHILKALARKVSVAKTLDAQLTILEAHAGSLADVLPPLKMERHSYKLMMETLEVMSNAHETDKELLNSGFSLLRATTVDLREKMYLTELEDSWNELTLCGKLRAMKSSYKWRNKSIDVLTPVKTADLKGRYDISVGSVFTTLRSNTKARYSRIANRIKDAAYRAQASCFKALVRACMTILPDLSYILNVTLLMTILIKMIVAINQLIEQRRSIIARTALAKEEEFYTHINLFIDSYKAIHHQLPTISEIRIHVSKTRPEFLKAFEELADNELRKDKQDEVSHQGKSAGQNNLERIVAFTALVMMMFDSERSDCVYRCLTKLKTLVSTADGEIRHQSADEILSLDEERKQTIDFEIEGNEVYSTPVIDGSFSKWWDNQLKHGNTIPHYRTEGHYMKFTRDTAASVAADIAHNEYKDILLQGGVGSGKSTGLPFHLNKKGSVLLIEPTRPLAQNVHKQLASAPFYTSTTLRMRGLHKFGSSSISVMTSGYALHHFANNATLIQNLNFVIFDECHVLDASAMAFRCLLHEFGFQGKIIKVSATPPGRALDFEPMHPVKIVVEEGLSQQQFVQGLGTGSNSDATKLGDNILVYVSSYNEVDTLAKMLNEKGHKVTKVDGRTMKLGVVEINTTGTPERKHFIVATNIIENGVTLDVDVVVDFGMKVIPTFDGDARLIRYTKKSITYGERIQRIGRVGRNKPGAAIRIGATEMGTEEIPSSIATEAAFLSFVYGLPVMTSNVSTGVLGKCTVRQAKTMRVFEMSPFYMVDLVHYDGTMHPAIHSLLKDYKLVDSTITLSKLAVPNSVVSFWKSAREYNLLGARTTMSEDTKIPFMIKDIPESLHEKVWEAIVTYKSDAGFGRMTSANACKLAYTLSTAPLMIPVTINRIDALLAEERQKLAYFESVTANTCSFSQFSLSSLGEAIRARYSKNHSLENIQILTARRDTILNFEAHVGTVDGGGFDMGYAKQLAEQYGGIDVIQHQSKDELAAKLGLKGRWNKSLITRDFLICCGVAFGGGWMIYQHAQNYLNEKIVHQGKSKRRLRYRDARDAKIGREVFGDDNTMEHHFGAAYTKKGKKSGRTHGTGKKTRAFINMYGFDPSDFSYIRYVDPITGKTLDDQPFGDMLAVQEAFGEERQRMLVEGELESQHMAKGLKAYMVKNTTSPALEIDLTPHMPTLLCRSSNNIAGYPNKEGILRQTGQARVIKPEQIPASVPFLDYSSDESISHENKSLFKGLRDYNPIAASVCKIVNDSDGIGREMHGIGFGHFVITNQHLFKENNGEIHLKTRHGEFTIKNSTQVKILPCEGRDLLLFQLPADVPPFGSKLQFRPPVKGEKVCLVGSNFQDKSITSIVSEASITTQYNDGTMWKHWIDTKDGHCGLPLVAISDGCIVGVHSAESVRNDYNFHVAIPHNFKREYIEANESQKWTKHWKYNPDKMVWGGLTLKRDLPKTPFLPVKAIELLDGDLTHQANEFFWFTDQLKGNLKVEAKSTSNLVTKHTVRGKCMLFELYLQLHPKEKEFFTPLMGHYQKSRLNREAFTKDIMKYSSVITAGVVDCDIFLKAEQCLINLLEEHDFSGMEYVTDAETIVNALNMKSAVGALYCGKKRAYFEGFSIEQRDEIVRESCKRLYTGKSGVWNGSLKAELRPNEKVYANKTRVFTAAPLDTLLAGKVCVDDFNNHFYSKNIKAPWTVGMTKFYGGWNELLQKLPEGWVYCDADGSQFDSSLSPFLINSILRTRLHFMEKWDLGEQMLKNLYTEIVYTAILAPDSTIVKKFKGNNSGQPSTVVDNTLMVILAMMYTLLSLGIEESDFNKTCIYFVNGDDLIIAINPEKEYLLDQFQEKFASLGLNYNFDSRTRIKSELWFMSHCGLLKDGMYIPKLEPERVVSILEWDRSLEPEHRLEAICAAMIESWGYQDLTHEIRKFYKWILEQQPYSELAKNGKAPYISETALQALYTNVQAPEHELQRYLDSFYANQNDEEEDTEIRHQGDDSDTSSTLDAGKDKEKKEKDLAEPGSSTQGKEQPDSSLARRQDMDLNAGTHGNFPIPRIKALTTKMKLPMTNKKVALNIDHLINYKPDQRDLSNTRSTMKQFNEWYEAIKREYEIDDNGMQLILNGLMVWCIENGTSPNINGVWVMMDGTDQVEYPLKPVIEYAKPTLRQIMAHFSDAAEAYIEMRNQTHPYMPRYGLQRNLNARDLARYAFDFYEVTSKTPNRAREAHHQMKAAALTGSQSKLFGLDGGGSNQEENTERHTAADVNPNMHTLLGAPRPY